jgi:hypothetical protein
MNSDLDIISMYESAWKQQPMNEELGIHVFSANTRAANWKAAQQVGLFCLLYNMTLHAITEISAGCYKTAQAIQG